MLLSWLVWFVFPLLEPGAPAVTLETNRHWDVLSADQTRREVLAQAATALGAWRLHVAGVEVDGSLLRRLAEAAPQEPFLRVVREGFGRPVDLDDFLLFLDDVLLAGQSGLRGYRVWVSSGRARSAGILLHPDDVFENRPREYGTRGVLNIDRPKVPDRVTPAKDGDLLGPEWTARFRNPISEKARLRALRKANPSFARRMTHLVKQLRRQGAWVSVNSTVRSRHRGYLMWGAFLLGRQKTSRGVERVLSKLEARNASWGLRVPITWQHPQGWRHTIEAAREMSDTYQVVYATERGARQSNHYDGTAIDVTALDLPRKIVLTAPSRVTRVFDLSDPQHARDVSLAPEIIEWIEEHYRVEKLRGDYPHWDDADRKDDAASVAE